MNFSNPIKYSGLASFSPDGKYFYITKINELLIYETENSTLPTKFQFQDFISHAQWSPDSEYILVGLFKKGICEARSIKGEDNWSCKIDEGLAGMINAIWSPDSRKILTFCEFNIRLTVWSLLDRTTTYIFYPKYYNKGLSFTNNGLFMAIAIRKESKDYIEIYYIGDWKLVNQFPVDTYDLADICWSKDNTAIIVWDSSLECKFLVYSPGGSIIASHQPYDLALGIKSVELSPNGHYLSVGFFDQNVRLYNHISWKLIIDLEHSSTINDCSEINVFREEEIPDNFNPDKKTSKYSLYEGNGPIKLPVIKPDISKPNPQVGIGLMAWSFDSNFLATRNDNMPCILRIWTVSNLSLNTVIIQNKPIKHFAWCPTMNLLLIVNDSNKLFFWSVESASACSIPLDNNIKFSSNKIEWNKDGKSILVSEPNYIVVGYSLHQEQEYEEKKTEAVKENEMENEDEYNEMNENNGEMGINLQRSEDDY